MAKLREHDIEVQLGGELLVQLHRAIVKAYSLGRQIVGTNDRRIPARISTAQVTAVQDRDVRNAVVPGEIVSGGKSMHSRSDDYDVIGRLEIVRPPDSRPVLAGQSMTQKTPRRITAWETRRTPGAVVAVARPEAAPKLTQSHRPLGPVPRFQSEPDTSCNPGIQFVPANLIFAIAAASTVSAARSSRSR